MLSHSAEPDPGQTTEVALLLMFAVGAYVVVGEPQVAVAAAKEHWSEGGLMVVSVLSGLTDMDAITLSTSRLVQDGRLEPVKVGRM